jgi:hypothetical protein
MDILFILYLCCLFLMLLCSYSQVRIFQVRCMLLNHHLRLFLSSWQHIDGIPYRAYNSVNITNGIAERQLLCATYRADSPDGWPSEFILFFIWLEKRMRELIL